ncbi:hypothetical protein PHLH5_27060 [Pseudomonas sp. Cab53]|nr:hypothetical protein PHLH5_27060 [Pseudomonas sp. Cab53]
MWRGSLLPLGDHSGPSDSFMPSWGRCAAQREQAPSPHSPHSPHKQPLCDQPTGTRRYSGCNTLNQSRIISTRMVTSTSKPTPHTQAE